MIDINWRPSLKELRGFALLWLLFFGLLGVWFFLRGSTETLISVLFGVAIIGGLAGLIFPSALRPVYVVWMCLAFPIGWLVSHLLLATIFFGLLLPTGLLLKACGYNSLHRKFDRNARSYWTPRPEPDDPKRYFRQF